MGFGDHRGIAGRTPNPVNGVRAAGTDGGEPEQAGGGEHGRHQRDGEHCRRLGLKTHDGTRAGLDQSAIRTNRMTWQTVAQRKTDAGGSFPIEERHGNRTDRPAAAATGARAAAVRADAGGDRCGLRGDPSGMGSERRTPAAGLPAGYCLAGSPGADRGVKVVRMLGRAAGVTLTAARPLWLNRGP